MVDEPNDQLQLIMLCDLEVSMTPWSLYIGNISVTAIEGGVIFGVWENRPCVGLPAAQAMPEARNEKWGKFSFSFPFPSSSINPYSEMILEQGNGEKERQEDWSQDRFLSLLPKNSRQC